MKQGKYLLNVFISARYAELTLDSLFTAHINYIETVLVCKAWFKIDFV